MPVVSYTMDSGINGVQPKLEEEQFSTGSNFFPSAFYLGPSHFYGKIMSAEYTVHLPRGKACVPCRRRKMKCDGNKPKCNQCLRFNRAEDCEYSEVVVPSTARVLEQHIARLQSRIQELEQDDPSLIKLHNPYNSPETTIPAAVQEWWQTVEPPPRVAQFLVNQFLPHASKFGFFFRTGRFTTGMFNPTVSKPRPPMVLRNVLYLWGISLSRDRQYTAHEPLFVNRALTGIHAALSSAEPEETLHVLQAEILLAYYFFHNGRLIEGKFHSAAAVSLAVMCNLHKQGGNAVRSTADAAANPFSFTLPQPKDAIEEGERIHAWWATFILDKCWVVALGSPSTILEDENNQNTRIDVPWPLDLETYGQQSRVRNSHTIQTFIQSLNAGSNVPDASISATYAKAAVLYERATRHAKLWEKDIASHQTDFGVLDAYIERFKQMLPSPERVNEEITHTLLIAHSLTHCATIQLHLPFIGRSSTSRGRCLTAANSIVRLTQILPVRRLTCLNPIVAVLWTTASEVLSGGVRSLRSTRSAWASSSALPGEDVLLAALTQMTDTAAFFAGISPYMNARLKDIRQYRDNV